MRRPALIPLLKKQVQRTLNRLGYEIQRPAHGLHGDAFEAQAALLGPARTRLVFDVGANVGQTSLRYHRMFPDAVIHAFEPFDESYDRLCRAVAGVPNIRPIRAAVADRSGSRQLRVNRTSSTNSLLDVSPGAGKSVDPHLMALIGQSEVRVITLDEYSAAEGIDRVGVLKLDVQGSELLALHGAESMLSSARIDLVYTEVLYSELYQGQAGFCDIFNALGHHSYVLYGLYDMNYGRNGMLSWSDALFVSPALEQRLSERFLRR
jgi:FkbM family methyltransferase